MRIFSYKCRFSGPYLNLGLQASYGVVPVFDVNVLLETSFQDFFVVFMGPSTRFL
jgi:hypothetical protein